MGNDDDPPPGGGPNVLQRVNLLNVNAVRQRSYSQSDTSDFVKVVRNKKRNRESPEKIKTVQKQLKLSHWLSKPQSTNQFSLLANDDNESDITAPEPQKKDPKPPPIYVCQVEYILPLKQLLEVIAENQYEMKIIKADEVKIQPLTIEAYRTVTKALEEKKTEFHTFRPKQERTYNVVLKGIHSSTPIDEIKEEIECLGHKVSNISNIKQRITKYALPLFYVSLEQKPNNKDIFNCKSLLHTKIMFEAPRKKREIAQCTRCQRYGHTKSYCHHKPRCVKCSENHLTADCPRKNRSDNVKCVLCNGNHPANYKGCATYKQLQEKSFPRLRPHQVESSLSTAPIHSTRKATQVSYADAVRNVETNSTNQQSSDFSELKSMMKTLLAQMSNMMTLLTTVITKLIPNGSN